MVGGSMGGAAGAIFANNHLDPTQPMVAATASPSGILDFVNGALNRDYSTIMGITILVGCLTITFNLIVDILYAWIDPKIRY